MPGCQVELADPRYLATGNGCCMVAVWHVLQLAMSIITDFSGTGVL